MASIFSGGMRSPFGLGHGLTLVRLAVMSTLIVMTASWALAHELRPAVGDLTIDGGEISLEIDLNLEALLSGIDLSEHEDTTTAPQEDLYAQLRALSPEALEQRLRDTWPEIAQDITIKGDDAPLPVELAEAQIAAAGDLELPRDSRITLEATLPAEAQAVIAGWDARFGPLVLRQVGPENAYSTYLTNGALSDPIPRDGIASQRQIAVFVDYVVLGFEHILPKGLDHILFVLGLFFLSLKLKPLLWQVSAFTLAHTVTLALGILGIVTLPASVVEPLIAASIVYVGVENVLSKGLTPWRPVIVFLFGLLHGLGFASVLGDVGLAQGGFITSLIGFNIGVEIGQLTVIAIAFLAVGYWFGQKPWYRGYIANPASIAIALVGTWWVIERTLL